MGRFMKIGVIKLPSLTKSEDNMGMIEVKKTTIRKLNEEKI